MPCNPYATTGCIILIIWLFKFQPSNKHCRHPAGQMIGGTTVCPPKTQPGSNSLKFCFYLICQNIDLWPHLEKKAGKYTLYIL